MTHPEQHTIDKLFRDLIRVYSTSATSVIGLDSFQTAIEELVCSDKNLVTEIIKLSDAVKNTQPRMFPLDNLMFILDKEIKSLSDKTQLTKEYAITLLDKFKKRLETDMDSLIQKGVKFIEDGDFHRVHNTSDKKLEFVCVFDGVRSH